LANPGLDRLRDEDDEIRKEGMVETCGHGSYKKDIGWNIRREEATLVVRKYMG
jgi:hypothetical protein